MERCICSLPTSMAAAFGSSTGRAVIEHDYGCWRVRVPCPVGDKKKDNSFQRESCTSRIAKQYARHQPEPIYKTSSQRRIREQGGQTARGTNDASDSTRF